MMVWRTKMKLTNRETIESCTAEWKGERDENGRPLVPDDILTRMESVTTEQAWSVLKRHGFTEQYEGFSISRTMAYRYSCTTVATSDAPRLSTACSDLASA